MRIAKYVRSDGENWVVAKIRHSPMCASAKLDDLMFKHGWIRWDKVREKFNQLKQRVARSNPTKFPNWKEVEIPMQVAKLADLPAGIHREIQLVDQDGRPIAPRS